jgi:hypothetical protein
MLVFFCVPVSPGRRRLIWAFPRNVGVWLDKIIPRWFYHINQNRVLDSDIYLLHLKVTEREMCITSCHAQRNGNYTFVVSPSSLFFVAQASSSGAFNPSSFFATELFYRSGSLQQQALTTGRNFAMFPHHRTTWSSPSEAGSENSVRIKLVGQHHKQASCLQPQPRISSWTGRPSSATLDLKPQTPNNSITH